MTTQTAKAVVVADGFDAVIQDPAASHIRGLNVKFKDGSYFSYSDEIDVRGRAFIVLDRINGWQKLAKETPPEYLMQKAGEARPLQPRVDKKHWPKNLNGLPEHPWKWTHYLYLLDATTGEIMTFWTNTVGGDIAVGQLTDQIALMRRVRPDAVPVVALEAKNMPGAYKKPRPHFQLLGWKTRSDLGPQNLLAGPEQKDADQMLAVEPPTSAESFSDEIP
jgi:hypothetical protein